MRHQFLTILLIGLNFAGSAQELISENKSTEPIQQWYKDVLGSNSRIYSGTEYAVRYERNVDHQFLLQDWESGSVDYQGRTYKDLELKFDIVNDEVIFKYFDPSDGRMMSLRPAQEKVSGFTINNRQFVKLAPSLSSQISGGFYEIIFDKDYKLYVKHDKEQFIDKSRGAPVLGFLYRDKLYFLKDSTYYLLRNRASLLKVLEDEKKALKSFARTGRIYWKENPRRSAALLVNYYLQLKEGDTGQ